jgi:hypothetical protein
MFRQYLSSHLLSTSGFQGQARDDLTFQPIQGIGMRSQITLFSLVAAIALPASTVLAMSSAKDAQQQVQEKPKVRKGIEGLKRQEKGSLGNENDAKAFKDLENQEKIDSKPSSSDDIQKKK